MKEYKEGLNILIKKIIENRKKCISIPDTAYHLGIKQGLEISLLYYIEMEVGMNDIEKYIEKLSAE